MDPEQSISAFTEALGSGAPTPGGGAASALVGALAAALAEMVARFTVGRKAYLSVAPAAEEIVRKAERARLALQALVAEDELAFRSVSAAYKRPQTTDEERSERDAAIQAALLLAMQPPMSVVHTARDVVALALSIAEIGNQTVLSDAACAATLGEAAARSAALNVLANVALMHDAEAAERALADARQGVAETARLREETLAAVYLRMGVSGI
ncbi:MAG TPA: cyclodeaminase/cyclohydrolase family protein [Ktedonobacterales bacterium]